MRKIITIGLIIITTLIAPYFIEGFDGTYLMWNSSERIWKIDNS